MTPYSLKEFQDVTLWQKAEAIKYYLFNVPFENQNKIKSKFWSNGTKELCHALDKHYCVSLVDPHIEFSFSSLLSNFQWCCEFLYFNFSETMWEFSILKKLEETGFSTHQLKVLMGILRDNPRPYSYPLEKYSSVLKFALKKNEHISRMDLIDRLRDRDRIIRERLLNFFSNRLKNETQLKNDLIPFAEKEVTTFPNKAIILEFERDNCLRFSDLITPLEKEVTISYLFNLFKPYFKKEYSLEYFSQIFSPTGEPVCVELNGRDVKMNPQTAFLLFSEMKNDIFDCTWVGIKKNFIALNKKGELIKTVYSIAGSSIKQPNQRKAVKYFSELQALLGSQQKELNP
jgi:hypothetical protein